MKQNNSIARLSLILGLSLVISSEYANSNINKEINVIHELHRPANTEQDSTYILFSLENDTVFIGKKFPPEGFKIDEGTFWPTDTNNSEANAIRERIKTSIDIVRYHYLKAHDVWISLAIYVDSTGTIREAQIRLKRQFEGLFNTDDLINICMSVKGLKYTLPPEYRHLPYVKFSFGYKFK